MPAPRRSLLIGAALTLALGASVSVGSAAEVDVENAVQTRASEGVFEVRYAYGAAWVAAPRRLVRVSPDGRVRKGSPVPGTIVDFTEGFGRMWILWTKGRDSYVAQARRSDGRIIGSPRRAKTRSLRSTIASGAGSVWVGGSSNVLLRVNPRTLRSRPTRLPGGGATTLFVEKGTVYTIAGSTLLGHRARDLRRTTRDRLPDGAWQGAVAYGAGNFFFAWGKATEADAANVTPGAGVTARTDISASFPAIWHAAVGLGSSWFANQLINAQAEPTAANITRLGPGLASSVSGSLPGTQSVSALTTGGGWLWLLDNASGVLYQVRPDSVG